MDMTPEIIPDLATGNFIEVYVHAILGVTKSADTPLIYDPTGPVVTFTCNGSTISFECKAAGYGDDEETYDMQ